MGPCVSANTSKGNGKIDLKKANSMGLEYKRPKDAKFEETRIIEPKDGRAAFLDQGIDTNYSQAEDFAAASLIYEQVYAITMKHNLTELRLRQDSITTSLNDPSNG
jgi:hypothetical protein